MAESIKLSVTVRSALENKYTPEALKKIDDAIAAWIAAEKQRGIKTVHVAIDNAADMQAQGSEPVTGKVTATSAKKAIDALAKKLVPDYIVIVGGDDVIPYFRLPNPIYDPGPNGDPDKEVFSDNPYATSRPYVASSSKSYLVPDRVVGRMPDLPAGKGKGDPATLLAALNTATKWKPQAKSFFKDAYATCTETWKQAGEAMMKYLEFPTADLMIAPPAKDEAPTPRKRLARTVHVTKCHGDDPDAHFFGESTRHAFPPVLFSGTLAGRVKPGALVAAVCCYGAGVYAPDNPLAKPRGALPVAIAYLHAGALAFMGSTKIAYVGSEDMLCGDRIVASYVKKALDGASLGRALLEAKQEYLAELQRQGNTPDTADEKTMLEFMLLGDPAIHPMASTVPLAARAGPSAFARRATLRTERRAARAVVAAEVEKALPTRTKMDPPSPQKASAIFKAAASLLAQADLKGIDPARPTVNRVSAPDYRATAPRMARRISAATEGTALGEVIEYTWSARLNGQAGPRMAAARAPAKERAGPIRLLVLKAQTDAEGNVIRSRTLHGA